MNIYQDRRVYIVMDTVVLHTFVDEVSSIPS